MRRLVVPASFWSRRKVLHCESIWLFISEDLTGRSHIGHATIVTARHSNAVVVLEARADLIGMRCL